MKQYISEEQVSELTMKQRDSLTDYLYHIDMYFEFNDPKTITLGKMIEVLNVSFKGRALLVEVFSNLTSPNGGAFKEDSKKDEWLDGVDLCDTLWNIILKDIING